MSTTNRQFVHVLNEKFSGYVSRKTKWQIIGLAIILGIWEIMGHVMGSFFLAPVSEVVPAYLELLTQTDFVAVTLSSLRQMFAGFAVAVGIGLPVGIAMGQSEKIGRMVDPWISAFFVTSTAALIPFFIILFGIDFAFRAAIVWVSAQWHVIIEMYEGTKEVTGQYSNLAESFEASRLQTYTKLVFPALVPYIMVALRLGLGRSVKGMILAEMFVVTGIGGFLMSMTRYESTAKMLAVLVTIMLIAVVLTGVLRVVGRRLAPWYDF